MIILTIVVRYETAYGSISAFAPQGTYWKEGKNVTVKENGKLYTRVSEWGFPVTSMTANWSPKKEGSPSLDRDV